MKSSQRVSNRNRSRRSRRCTSHAALTRTEFIVIAGVLSLAAILALPGVLAIRDTARLRHCADNLRAIGVGLSQYQETYGSLPAAAVWRPGSTATLMLNEVKRIDLITYENWAVSLLPHLDESDLARQFDLRQPIMSVANAAPRLVRPHRFICPADAFNRADNPHAFQPEGYGEPLANLARGNYAINGGTHNPRFTPETPAEPRGDGLELVLDPKQRLFRLVGSGVAGINRAFRVAEFTNVQSTLVAVEELRAGIHPVDPRGVWALGQIGGSITWGHGVAGDAGRPNSQWVRSDDILGCKRLHATVGSEVLSREGMPCVDYVDRNDQATSRSLHEQGVNVLFVDGQVRFVNDQIDPGVWHVMHSRDTPANVLAEDLPANLGHATPRPDARLASSPNSWNIAADTRFENSIGMKFVVVPPGEFDMGTPDSGQEAPPPECPVHRVRITRAFCLGQYEVTCGEYRRICGNGRLNTSHPDSAPDDASRFPQGAVNWNDASEFCRMLSMLPAERAARRRYRLPTEAEWEYACRAGKSAAYTWDRERPPGDVSGDNAGRQPSLPLTRVGSYLPNAFGLFDMRGNVWEWCSDWFDRGYYGRSPVDDPQGPASGYLKVVRGGDWIFVGELCRINYPIMPPWKTNPYVGFRVVCESVSGQD